MTLDRRRIYDAFELDNCERELVEEMIRVETPARAAAEADRAQLLERLRAEAARLSAELTKRILGRR